MAISDQELLHHFSRTPFVDSAELALILGEPHTTVHPPKAVPPTGKFAIQYAPAHFSRLLLTVDITELDNKGSSPN